MKSNIKLVEIPKSKTYIQKKSNGREYVYYRTKYYRNEKGQPTSKSVLLGRKDTESGMLAPNETYYEIFGEETAKYSNIPQAILDYGNTYVLDKIMRKYDIQSTLKYAFQDTSSEISLLAKYMLCEGNVFYYCDDWCDETYIGEHDKMTSQQASKICSKIDYERKMKFFKRWVYARNKEEYLAYDITSISSYSTGNDNIEWGYNRDGEDLPQINLGILYGETSKLPIYYNVYPGSITDKTYLEYMLNDAKKLGISCTKLVMDKGFFSKDNIQKLNQSSLRFIVSLPLSQKIPRKLIEQSQYMQYESKYSLGATLPKARCVEITDYGFRANVHVYFDSLKFYEEEASFNRNLEKRKKALQTMKEPSGESNAYDKYFIITKSSDGKLKVAENYEAIDGAITNFGYFLILTTDFKSSSKEILEIYRQKDVVEKCFDNLKNAIDMKRLRTHSTETTDGKCFIAFISLAIRSVIENTMSDYMKAHNLSFKKVMKELAKIKLVEFKNSRTLLNPLTKKQKEILGMLDIQVDDLYSDVKRL